MQGLRAFSVNGDEEPTTPTLAKPGTQLLDSFSPRKISSPTRQATDFASRVSPELTPIVTLLSAQAHRKYQEGSFMLLKDLDSDGNPAERKWIEVYGIMVGNELAYWDSEQLEQSKETSNKPSYINYSDSTFKACLNLPSASGQIQNVIVLSTTLKNRFLLQFSSKTEFSNWHASFLLASYEYKALQEAYTASLLSARGSLLSDIRVILSEKKFAYEEWTSVRFGAGMPWKRCYAVIEPCQKKRKGISKGKIYFYENEKKQKKTIMATITDAESVYAVYPQNHLVIDQSTMIKLDCLIQFEKKDEPKSCFIFLMPEQHSAVPGYDTLIRFLIPVMDSFAMYGRPVKLNADRKDPNSLLFAMPILPKAHYLELTDIKSQVEMDASTNWSQFEWRKYIKGILERKTSAGYTGCGETRAVNSKSNIINASKDLSSGEIQFFVNRTDSLPDQKRTLDTQQNLLSSKSEISLPRENLFNDATLKQQNKSLFSNDVNVFDDNEVLGKQSEQSPTRAYGNNNNHLSTPRLEPEQTMISGNSPSPQVASIYKNYSQIPDSSDEHSHLEANFGNMSMGSVDLYPHDTDEEQEQEDADDEDADFFIAKPNNVSKDRVLSPFTDFNKSFSESIKPNMQYTSNDTHRIRPNIKVDVSSNSLNLPKQRSPEKEKNSSKLYPTGGNVSHPDFNSKNSSNNSLDFIPNRSVSKETYSKTLFEEPVVNPYMSPQTPVDQQQSSFKHPPNPTKHQKPLPIKPQNRADYSPSPASTFGPRKMLPSPGGPMSTQGYPPQQSYPPQQGYLPQQGYKGGHRRPPNQGYPPPQQYPPQGYQQYPPQGYQQYPPQGYQRYPPAPPPQQGQGYLAQQGYGYRPPNANIMRKPPPGPNGGQATKSFKHDPYAIAKSPNIR